ncbi:TPA: hypothetical protein DEO28_04625 [Candidatus Dependentiae bacterium]|nr:MAG: Peptidoglycan-associated lipoprotein [candidate division TM6 bacterium GW2011_GWE2_31_21]KKP53839.1 MAG: Peptidoglycan-associated lipoprotein [candidate division TM6 bacterium GW2011_GWF2_33_332]HBS47619.1 hypothetical protein [Candidatus Dependentiae bacterium]HBZ73768.1 hypothetical protein [Candidatus Dependentiae bacterium]
MKILTNKIFNVTLVLCLVSFAGCGKKKHTTIQKTPVVKEVKDKAANTVTPASTEYAFDESIPNLENFSFVEDSSTEAKDKKSNFVAEADLEIDDQDLSEAIKDAEEVLASNSNENSEFDRIMFGFDKDNPLEGQDEVIKKDAQKAAELISQGKKVSINGHCCQIGQADYNLALSLKRANKVKDEFERLGISQDNVKVVGCGQENPLVSSNSDDRTSRLAELAPNRRAEILALTK